MADVPPDSRTRELAQRYAAVRERVAEAILAAGRTSGDVELLVVTKFFPAEDVRRLIDLGVRTFGESREPEASRKIAELDAAGVTEGASFDMIGTVQSKKAKSVATWARSVHSVDRPKIVDALSGAAETARDAGRRSGPLSVLLELSLDGDPQRGGVTGDELPALADRVAGAPGLTLGGLMVIAPVDGSADRWMAQAAQMRADFLIRHPDATEFSAGMSGDLEAAVAHGSTCVRVGTAILGPRPLVSQ